MNITDEVKKAMELNEDYLAEMARVGKFKTYDGVVWTNDPGKVPHFHIIDSNTRGNDFHCCIKLLCAEYFSHTGKENILNSILKKELIKFLQSPSSSSRFSSFTNWQVLLTLWNMNNSDIEVDENTEMPDYTAL